MVKHTQPISRQLPTNWLSEFDHFMGFALKVFAVSNLVDISVNDHPLNFNCVPNYEKKVFDKHISKYVEKLFFILHAIFLLAHCSFLFDLVMFATFRFQPSSKT